MSWLSSQRIHTGQDRDKRDCRARKPPGRHRQINSIQSERPGYLPLEYDGCHRAGRRRPRDQYGTATALAKEADMTEFVDVPGGRIAYDVTAGRCPAAPRLAVRIRLGRRGHPCRSL